MCHTNVVLQGGRLLFSQNQAVCTVSGLRRGWGGGVPGVRVKLAKAGQSDFLNPRFKPETGKMRKMRKALSPCKNKGLRRLRAVKKWKTQKCGHENAENAADAADWL